MNSWDAQQPWFENEKFIPYLLEKVDLEEIVKRCELKYENVSSGKFTARMICPFHMDGQERTASLFFNSTGFHCFACNVGGNAINFLAQLKGMPYYIAIEKIAKIYGLIDIDDDELDLINVERVKPEHTIDPYIYHTGIIIREHLKGITNGDLRKWEKWAEKEFKRLDYYAENLSDSQWEKVKNNQDRIMRIIQGENIL